MTQPGIVREGYIELFSEYIEEPFARLLPGMLWPGEAVAGQKVIPADIFGLPSNDMRLEAVALDAEAAKAAWELLQLRHLAALPTAEGIVLALRYWGPFEGHEELATVLGVRRETVTKALQSLRRRGQVEMRYGFVGAA